MNYTHEEIYNALQIIKDTCNEINHCGKCPFYFEGECMVCKEDYSPTEWHINDPNQWRAFS